MSKGAYREPKAEMTANVKTGDWDRISVYDVSEH